MLPKENRESDAMAPLLGRDNHHRRLQAKDRGKVARKPPASTIEISHCAFPEIPDNHRPILQFPRGAPVGAEASKLNKLSPAICRISEPDRFLAPNTENTRSSPEKSRKKVPKKPPPSVDESLSTLTSFPVEQKSLVPFPRRPSLGAEDIRPSSLPVPAIRRRSEPDAAAITKFIGRRTKKLSRSYIFPSWRLSQTGSTASTSTCDERESLEGYVVFERQEGISPPVHLHLGRCIRHDQFDSVYQALNVNTGLNIAVRCLRLEGLRQEQTAALVREIDMVENLSHPNIVKYQVIPKDNIVILESVAHDSLIENTKTFGSSGEPLVASYVVQILEGLCYLHRSQLGAHGNLTAANILTDTDGNIKLSEFGPFLNTLSTTPSRNMAGTADFSTPELQLRFASRKFDIWALGCTIIELLTLKPPLPEIDDEIWHMFDADSILGSCSDQLRDFLLQCFSKDPISRPIAEELCEHPWLQKYSDSRNLKLDPQNSVPLFQDVLLDINFSPISPESGILTINNQDVLSDSSSDEICLGRARIKLPYQYTASYSAIYSGPPVWPAVLWVTFRQVSSRKCHQSPSPSMEDLVAIIQMQPNHYLWDDTDDQWLRDRLTTNSSVAQQSWLDLFPSGWRYPLSQVQDSEWIQLTTASTGPSDSRRDNLKNVTTEQALGLSLCSFVWTLIGQDDPETIPNLELLQAIFDSVSAILAPLRLPQFPRDICRDFADSLLSYLPRSLPRELAFLYPEAWIQGRSYLLKTATASTFRQYPAALPLSIVFWVLMRFHSKPTADIQVKPEGIISTALLCNWTTDSITACRVWRSLVLDLLREGSQDTVDLQELHGMLSLDALTISAQILLIIRSKVMFRDLLSRRDDEAKSLLDLLHQLLDLHDPPARVKAEFTTALIQLSESSGCIADCLVLDGLVRSGHAPVAGGSFDDVWKGQLGGQDVAVKVIRVFQDEVNDFLKVFHREAIILWSQLSHPNVLPLYGIYYLDELRARVCLVSPWMACGNLVQFLKNPPAGLDMHTLLLDTASGLEYLHELSIAHGDIKAVNILVTPAWRACITGFEVSSVVNSNILKWSSLGSSPNRGGTARWMAPEVLNGAPTNFARDIYAFACVCYEIFARCLPFRDLSDAAVIKQVLNGVRPDRPDSAKLYDKTWELMQDCWAADPDNRPTASQVVERLSSFPDTTVTRSQTKWDESFPRSLRASLRPQAPLLPVIAELEQLFKPQHMPIVGL